MKASNADQVDLYDAHLWRALEHAPDHNAAPDWRLRKAILKRAHDAIGALDPDEAEAELELAAHSGWQGLFARRGGRSRMPWKTAFLAVLVAVVVAVFWRREPAPVPRSDSEARMTAPAPQAKEIVAPSPSEGTSADRSVDLVASSAPPAVAEVPESVAEPAAEPAPPPEPSPPPTVKAPKVQDAAAPQAPPKLEGLHAGNPLPPPAPAPTQSNAVARLVVPDSPAARSGKEGDASAMSPSANGAKPPTPVKAAPPSPSVRTEATDPPTFAALSQWSRITISRRGGESRSFPRDEARDLNALLGSAALSAVEPQVLKAAPEWRVTLERNGEVLAVFEVAASQVRWREGRTPAATGVPSAPALSALREALSNAVHQPEAATQSESPRAP
jgi:hypothetical protein